MLLKGPFKGYLPQCSSLKCAAPSFLRRDHPVAGDRSPTVTEGLQKVPSLFQRLFSQKPEVHLDRLYSIIYELASRGNAVFLGRGSHILLRAFKCALHIRVTASLEKRIQNLVERGSNEEAAIKAIHKTDHER